MNRINLICLGVNNMEKALAFYKNLGFKTYEKQSAPPIVFFDTSGTKLELYPLEKLAEDINEVAPPVRTENSFPGITLAINLKSKEEVDTLMAKVAQLGGDIIKQPQQNPLWDGYSGYFKDLDGYYWEVAYGKLWQFDENDMLIIE